MWQESQCFCEIGGFTEHKICRCVYAMNLPWMCVSYLMLFYYDGQKNTPKIVPRQHNFFQRKLESSVP